METGISSTFGRARMICANVAHSFGVTGTQVYEYVITLRMKERVRREKVSRKSAGS
jgi:hypothetical protein